MKKLPKHENPTQADRRAHAPYNFVPLPEKVVTVEDIPPQDVYSGYTGYIECSLTTESPLYTRAAMNPEFFKDFGSTPFHELSEEQKEQRARFFHLKDVERPAIPGSSLRGMVRTLVEIVGYGKMQWVTDEQLIYRAVGDPSSLGDFYRSQLLGPNKTASPNTHLDYPSLRLKGGYLRRSGNGWTIQPAVEHLGESFVHVDYSTAETTTHGCGKQNVYDVFVGPARRQTSNRGHRGPGYLSLELAVSSQIAARPSPNATPPAGLVPATLIESGHMGGQHAKHWHCAIYEPDSSIGWIEIPDDLWAIYKEDRDLTRGLKTRKLENDKDPLFYLLDSSGKLVFFGPTMMFRLPYPNTPLDLVPGYLRNESDLDFAEAIFGYVKGSEIPVKDRACAGRVSFTDAVFCEARDGVWASAQFIQPKILGSPKPTSFQHYLTQQEPDNRKQLDHYASPPPHKSVVRGHKLYWHQGEVGMDDIRENDPVALEEHSSQYTGVKPVKKGVTFKFKIHFENLYKEELGALLWTLMLPGESGKVYRHELGMGKPLGMGAVHLQPKLFLSSRVGEAGRYSRLYDRGQDGKSVPRWHFAESPSDIQSFVKAFNDHILAQMDQTERNGATHLKDVPRIQALLRMLEWPGPGRHLAGYMELSEFRPRPVLPDPLAVVAGKPVRPPAHQRDVAPTSKPSAEIYTGVVRWFDDQKGYGFIAQDGGGDVFVHYSGIEGTGRGSLREGQRVQYTVGEGRKGPQAQNVKPL